MNMNINPMKKKKDIDHIWRFDEFLHVQSELMH